MPRTSIAGAALLTFLAATPAIAAQDAVYQCTVSGGYEGHWLGKDHVIVVENDKAKVSNAMIQHFVPEKHLDARIDRDSDRALSLTWKVTRIISSEGQRAPDMAYRLTLQKRSLEFTISAVPGRYSNTFTGSGRCKPLKK